MLVREGHLSDEQFERLSEMEDPDLDNIKEVITNAKDGEGLKFLPTIMVKIFGTFTVFLQYNSKPQVNEN